MCTNVKRQGRLPPMIAAIAVPRPEIGRSRSRRSNPIVRSVSPPRGPENARQAQPAPARSRSRTPANSDPTKAAPARQTTITAVCPLIGLADVSTPANEITAATPEAPSDNASTSQTSRISTRRPTAGVAAASSANRTMPPTIPRSTDPSKFSWQALALDRVRNGLQGVVQPPSAQGRTDDEPVLQPPCPPARDQRSARERSPLPQPTPPPGSPLTRPPALPSPTPACCTLPLTSSACGLVSPTVCPRCTSVITGSTIGLPIRRG